MADPQNPHLISYVHLQRLLGALGILLPVLLVFGLSFYEDFETFQPSISHYYLTPVRDLFVCVLSAFGLFLYTYKGFDRKDSIASTAAGLCALLVAFFPTSMYECKAASCWIHFGAATLFFLILAYISFFLFTQSNKPPSQRTIRKGQRNRIYRISAVIMVGCIVFLAIYFHFLEATWPENTVFIFETIALWAFGVSWLVKGETILAD